MRKMSFETSQVSDPGNNWLIAFHHSCKCPLGFEGPTCQTNADDCEDHDCENGATCVDGVNNYTCFCPPYYTGQLTKHTIRPAFGVTVSSLINQRPFPCAQGRCVKKWRMCAPPSEAPASTSLPASSPPPDPSERVPLRQIRQRSCFDSDPWCCLRVCRCVCSPGYVGDDCSVDYNDCGDHRCQNGAQCIDELNGYSCVCHQGYR